jgi:hypothetical protein
VKINGIEPEIEISKFISDSWAETFFKPRNLVKYLILGQKGWSFFPSKAENDIYKRATNIR